MKLQHRVLTLIVISALVVSTLLIINAHDAKADDNDITLSGTESQEIKEATICANISLSGDATLIVNNTYLRINGLVRMSGNARLFIIRSTVELTPPAINDSTIVFHAAENSRIRVEDFSTLIFEPQPTPTNISYMLVEGTSSFYIKDSYFYGKHPSIINQSIEVASVTAGVYLLSGYASWYIINSEVEGRLSFESGLISSRWFWCSLHQRSTLTIEDTDIQLITIPFTYTLIKPVSGVVTIRDSRVLDGTIDAEVTSEVHLENSSFAKTVEFKDQVRGTVTNCTFDEKVIIGSALTMFDIEVHKEPETHVEISGSIFGDELRCESNSTTYIRESNLTKVSANENATVNVTDSNIEIRASVNDESSAELKRSYVGTMKVHDTAVVKLDDMEDISTINIYGTGEGEKEESAWIQNTRVEELNINYNSIKTVVLENVDLDRISFYDEVDVSFICKGSSIMELYPWRSGENVTLSFTMIHSNLPDLTGLTSNVTVRINHRLEVLVTLNLEGVEIEVEVKDDFGQVWNAMAQDGRALFDLPYKTINTSVNVSQNYEISASYLGFSEVRDITLNCSQTFAFEWMDTTPPDITIISVGPKQWNMGKDITVRAEIRDSGVISISSVTLVYYYTCEDGVREEMEMVRVGENTYEAVIPGQNKECDVHFLIYAEDMAGNQAASEFQEVTVGQEETRLYISILIISICLTAAVLVRKLIIHRKIKNYANKYESKGGAE